MRKQWLWLLLLPLYLYMGIPQAPQAMVTERAETKTIEIKGEVNKPGVYEVAWEQLDTLPGIGPKIAQRIIEERTSAPFVLLEDIKRVKGIGDKLFEKMKDKICL